MYGQKINFGKYEGKTIEYIFIKDYGWLDWAMQQSNLSWIKSYVEKLPCIYPQKVKVCCGVNHHAGCKTRQATRVSFSSANVRYYDYKSEMYISKNKINLNNGYFWCNECDIYSANASKGSYKLVEYPLKFEEVLQFETKKEREDFIRILKSAYGIRILTEKSAYKLFWE
ncbi:MAG: hypothetical protein ACFFFT_16090 [Candidatus Thorarchaeota archaeon]